MKKKKLGGIIGLLFLMWASITGQYLGIEELYEKAWLLGLIDTAIISVIMMIIPFIFRLVNKRDLEFSKGKKICKWNSISMFILSIILSVVILEGNGTMGIGGVGAIMFYFINKWLFVSEENINKNKLYIELEEKELKKEKKKSEEIIEEAIEEEVVKVEKKKNKYCKLCGGKLDLNNKCKKCGKQYFKLNKNMILYFVIGLLIISNLVFLILFIDEKGNGTEYIKLDNEDSWCETTMDILTKGKSWTYTSDKLDFFDENIVFVIEGYGNNYYSYDCVQEITEGEYTYWAYNEEAAIVKGYKKGTCN